MKTYLWCLTIMTLVVGITDFASDVILRTGHDDFGWDSWYTFFLLWWCVSMFVYGVIYVLQYLAERMD